MLTHRLVPDTGKLRGFGIGALVSLFMAGMILYAMLQGTAPDQRELWVARGAFGLTLLFGVGFIVAMLRRAMRRWSARAPVVEVDAQPWRPGQRHQVRVVVPDPKSLVELDVSLRALSWEPVGSSKRRISQVPVHTTTLACLADAELEAARASGRIDRTLDVVLPTEAATQARWLWGINVRGTTKALTPFQQELMAKMLRGRIPKHLQEADRELIYGELTRNIGRGTPAWEDWFRVEIDRPGT